MILECGTEHMLCHFWFVFLVFVHKLSTFQEAQHRVSVGGNDDVLANRGVVGRAGEEAGPNFRPRVVAAVYFLSDQDSYVSQLRVCAQGVSHSPSSLINP